MVNPNVKPSVATLKEIKLLKSFTEVELTQLIELGEGLIFEAHTNIIIEGELSWGLYIMLEGSVGVFKTNKLTGNSYDVGQLKSGSFFGEMSLVDEFPRSATVRALTECSVFYISKESFLHFLEQPTDIMLRFYLNCVKNLVLRLRELDDDYVISQFQLWQSALKKEAS
jgi:CRP-like cAMP-binding protein